MVKASMKPCNAHFYRYVICVGMVFNLRCRLIQVIYNSAQYKSCCTESVTPARRILAMGIHENAEHIIGCQPVLGSKLQVLNIGIRQSWEESKGTK